MAAEAARLTIDGSGRAEVLDAEGVPIAVGVLAVDLMPDATATDKLGATVRFVGEPIRRGASA